MDGAAAEAGVERIEAVARQFADLLGWRKIVG